MRVRAYTFVLYALLLGLFLSCLLTNDDGKEAAYLFSELSTVVLFSSLFLVGATIFGYSKRL